MTRLNYNRPNGGYSRFKTAKELPDANPISRTQKNAYAAYRRGLKTQHQQVNQPPEQIHGTHRASVRGSPGKYLLWCEKCKCEIMELNAEQYQIWKELNPSKVIRAQK